MQHHEQHGQCQRAEVQDDELAGIYFPGVGGQAGPQDAQPDDGDELTQHRREVDLALGHRGADEARVVCGVGEPGDAPADADRRHDRAHRGDAFRAFQDVACRAGVGPVDLHAEPRHCRHHGQDDDGWRDGPFLEGGDGFVAEPGNGDLGSHDESGNADLPRIVVGLRIYPPQGSEQRHDQVQDDPGVDCTPADHQKGLNGRREVVSAPAKGGAGQYHACRPRLLAQEDEAPEEQHPDQVAQDKDGDRIREPQAELDAERSEHPVDRREVGASPDPELAGHLAGPL
ncbi:hypothetical protein SAMN05660473_02023 [Arthrobacter sp. 49Tsu3.1M3]|nr:hypothetical protein SAMN05660473_02023 [Arthrobacter sp. 49Tsu3.1M3]